MYVCCRRPPDARFYAFDQPFEILQWSVFILNPHSSVLNITIARLVAFLRPNTAPADTRPMLMLIFIVALLGEHCNFDRLRRERESEFDWWALLDVP